MSNTHTQLMQQWKTNSLTLTEVREHYFTHLKTDKRLRALIKSGEIKLRIFKLTESRLERPRVRLTDLAEFLDTHAKPAA
jgi:hypothetical protein